VGAVIREIVLGQHNRVCRSVLDSGLGDGPVLAVNLVQGTAQAPRRVLVTARQSRSGLRATTSSAPGASFSTGDPHRPATTAFFNLAIGAKTIATRTLSRVRKSFPYTVTNCSPDSGQASGLARRVPCEGRARLSRVCGDSPSRLLVASFQPCQV
jgi:hypothetical protein